MVSCRSHRVRNFNADTLLADALGRRIPIPVLIDHVIEPDYDNDFIEGLLQPNGDDGDDGDDDGDDDEGDDEDDAEDDNEEENEEDAEEYLVDYDYEESTMTNEDVEAMAAADVAAESNTAANEEPLLAEAIDRASEDQDYRGQSVFTQIDEGYNTAQDVRPLTPGSDMHTDNWDDA